MSSQIREQDIYLQLGRASNGWQHRERMTLVSATLSPPATRKPKTVLVKIKVRVPDKAFDPAAIPALVADIPLDLLHPPLDELEVVVDDANPQED